MREGGREEDGTAGTWWLGDHNHIAGEPDVAGSPTLERDGRVLEVAQHVGDGGEVQVLHSALAPLRQQQAQVLGSALEVEGEHVLPAPGLALPHQEHPVRVRALQLHQLGRLTLEMGPWNQG